MIIIYLAQVGKDKFGKAGRPMDMPILPSLKLKLQDSRQFYHKMYRYSIKVVTAIFITWLSPRSMGVSGTEAQKKQLSEKSFTLLSLHNEHTWASSLFLTERTEEKDQICWRNKKMSRTGNQLLSNLVYKREHDSSPEQHPTMAENINKAIALSWSQRPLPHPLTSCRLADMIDLLLPLLWARYVFIPSTNNTSLFCKSSISLKLDNWRCWKVNVVSSSSS